MCVPHTHSSGARELWVGAAPPFPGPRQEARRPAARPNRLGVRPPACLPLTSLPGRLPGRRARAGPGRCLGPGQVRVGGGTHRSPSLWPPPRLLRRGEGIFRRSDRKLYPLAGGGTRGKVNQSSKSREDAVSRSLLFILSLRLCGGTEYIFSALFSLQILFR